MEVVDDFRILFDFMLPLILLYGPERQQYKRLRENATVNSHTESDIKLKQEVHKGSNLAVGIFQKYLQL